MTRLLQIVPSLPPAEGVGDYAHALARALAAAGTATTFLVPRAGAPEPAVFPVRAPSAPTAAALAEALAAWSAESPGEAAVLVHYANYAYERRGCPAWLVDGLAHWRADAGGRRLVAFFHEVHASGPPWRRSFWLAPAQRRLAGALARASDRAATSLEIYRGLLARWVPAEAIAVLPVFSTVGEPTALAPLAARHRRLVVFGGPGTRARAYREGRAALAATLGALGIAEVADIGADAGRAVPAEFEGAAVTRHGLLPAAAVGALLADSLAGFVAHGPAFLGKSTVFAAYCAHGMLPVVPWKPAGEAPAWAPGDERGAAALQAAADAGAAWYAGHSIARQAAAFQGLLGAAA